MALSGDDPPFRLTLQPVPGWAPVGSCTPVPVAVRQKRLLKSLLRAYGFRLLAMEDMPPYPPPPKQEHYREEGA